MLPKKVNILKAATSQIQACFDPHIVGAINDTEVKVAKFGEVFDWHTHADQDEAFMVLKGEIAIDFRDGSVQLAEGDFLVVAKGTEHRPRSISKEPFVLLIEPSGTLNTGDADSEYRVETLKVLKNE